VTRESQAGPAAVPAQLGERFPSGLRIRGRYRVISEIGAGAFGTVCLGEDESTGHRVAIRFLPRNFASTPQAAQAVMRMGRSIIAASGSHPAMARVLEFGELDMGRPFTVTELVEGRRLDQVVAARPALEIHAALRLALELGGAIETLHNMGFVHGAIAPRNVIVLEDGHLKLLDLELSGLRDAREVQALVNVEPPAEYLSPEQIQKAPITEKTDIYAFGVVLHELLSGAPPFQGTTREAIFTKHLKEAPPAVHKLRDGVPASVSRAVTLALYKQPEARPLMGDVLNLLWTGAHGPAPRRTRAAVIAGGAVLATAAVAAVIWGALSLRTPASPSSPSSVREATPASAPVPTAPSIETRRPPGVPVNAATESVRPPVESSAPTVRTPEPASVTPPAKTAPTVATPPTERTPAALPKTTPPPAPVATSPAPAVTRPAPATPAPAPAVTPPPAVMPPPAVATPRPTTAPPAATPPAAVVTPSAPSVTPPPAIAAPSRPAPVPPAAPSPSPAVPPSTPSVPPSPPTVAAPPRPAPAPASSTQTTTPPAARPERPAQTQPAPATQQPGAPDPDDSRAVIDWLLKPR
jgi:eukaryotic-like serine/threonine-protein kinase